MRSIYDKGLGRDGLSLDRAPLGFESAMSADGWILQADAQAAPQTDAAASAAAAGTPPVVVVNDHSVPVNHWTQIESWLAYADQDHDAATMYQFYDGGSAAGGGQFWTPSGGYQAADTVLSVAAADLHDVWVGGATALGTETMYVRAFDGDYWSQWDSFNFTAVTNTAPTINVTDQTLTLGHWDRVENLFSVSDANGDAATMYQFYDSGSAAGSGQFWTPGGGYQAADTVLTAAPADLHNVWIGGASTTGTETMYIRAFDGTDWSNWTPFNLTSQPNVAPTATVGGLEMFVTTWQQMHVGSNTFDVNYADANGDAAVAFQFYDDGNAAGGGRIWTAANSYQAPATILTVAAADIGSVYIGGSTDYRAVEQMYVRAFDGQNWSDWDPFSVTGPYSP
jgi:hypothetical protein